MTPTVIENGTRVEVFDTLRRRWVKTQVDVLPGFAPEHGWICVVGWPGMAGPVSVRVDPDRLRRIE